MLDFQTAGAYKWRAPDALVMQGWRSNHARSSPAMAKPYFRSNYAEVKTQFEPPFDNCVCIPLTQGQHALVDNDDFELVSGRHWQFYAGYAWTTINNGAKRGVKSMHLFMVGESDYQQTDHANMNGLDNRRQNIRPCTYSQNLSNKPSSTGKIYKGAYKREGRKKTVWESSIRVNHKSIYLGQYQTEREAAIAYDLAAIKYHGIFAYLNFPRENYNE
jgi:hypothetical protein